MSCPQWYIVTILVAAILPPVLAVQDNKVVNLGGTPTYFENVWLADAGWLSGKARTFLDLD